ncbi:RNA polymerase sigma-70 factor (ECF subfamily) [Winogradskyella epiphytica]|uniref:RNA polymerase sigma-70 factor (ECF subfamily) n=1 Tax=Winogradskyella epiphytica TaxID=262005 RepID=A0A2V4WWB0_9FLAO|nr:sigma-70 family RNA polymerase sigma factor [Winogradskyella epiphytica]PYE81516.1 RNA polymerase sigma-70 factor (ECF subfamily) [Winogradskyella epiphytica]GGW64605.1 RNA polymerase sigma factor [Winogradskyella epiphytica]
MTQDAAHSLTDEALVEAIVKTNNTMLFEVLYDRYSSMVYNMCYGFANGKDEAKDLTQDVFLRVFIKLKTFKGKSKFSTWLYAFTYNHCVNYVTRNTAKKLEKKSVSSENVDIQNIGEDVDSTHEFASMRVEQLQKVMELISPEEKMILLLKYQDNLSIKELSEAFDIGESAVKMRLKRAKEKLILKYTNYTKDGESI